MKSTRDIPFLVYIMERHQTNGSWQVILCEKNYIKKRKEAIVVETIWDDASKWYVFQMSYRVWDDVYSKTDFMYYLQSRQMECVFAVTATHPCYRSGPINGERIKIWILKHRNLSHSHALESNPFHYQEHSLLHPGNLLAIADGSKH
jgi:hypothetical protein